VITFRIDGRTMKRGETVIGRWTCMSGHSEMRADSVKGSDRTLLGHCVVSSVDTWQRVDVQCGEQG
jgi:hypothetical protein